MEEFRASFYRSPTRNRASPDLLGSMSRNRLFAHQQPVFCTRAHHVGALVLVAVSVIFTRFLDRTFSHCSSSFDNDRILVQWPDHTRTQHISLKIYVYDEREIEGLASLMYGRGDKDSVISQKSCVKGQWGTQVKIHQLLLKSKFRTFRKEEADLFFVPSYVKCVRMMGGLNDREINETYVKVLSQMPYFRLSGGRNHIFIFPSGAGAHLFKSWATYLNRSIILTPEGDRTDKRDISAFNTWKDIIIPGNIDDAMTTAGHEIVSPLPISERKYLANFLGRAQGKTARLQLIALAKQFPNKLECPELKFSGSEKLGRREYFQHLRNAKFCLAPRGESSWTLRFYEAFFVECVPVILSDQVELPFQDMIDYRRISIKWPSTRIGPQLLNYLESIPDTDIEEMIRYGKSVRCFWVYSLESLRCSAMVGILWELQRKVRLFHQSAETFWLHNGSVVNRELLQFNRWKFPLPLP